MDGLIVWFVPGGTNDVLRSKMETNWVCLITTEGSEPRHELSMRSSGTCGSLKKTRMWASSNVGQIQMMWQTQEMMIIST